MTDVEIPLGKRQTFYRFFEMLPAILSYLLILLPIIMSIVNPLVAAIFIIGYDVMWFVKSIAMAFRITQGFNLMQKAQRINWLDRLNDLNDVDRALDRHNKIESIGWRQEAHYKNLLQIASNKSQYYKPRDVYSVVIIPFYNEGADVLIPTIKSVLNSHYDHKNTILILAYEQRGGESTKRLANQLVEDYASNFYHMAAIMHPKGAKEEVMGKGANITYAGHYLKRFLDDKKIDPDKVIVTTLDADNRPHPSYLACVTYEYIITPEHRHRAFQPVSIYTNNIWDAPAPMRVVATGNSFWTIMNSVRPHMLRNFSSHSQGMSSLLDTNFWSVRTIVEDGHQYWRSYFTFDGDYEVFPIYVPIYQDAVLAETYTKTLKAQFIQMRRWAYGASEIAYVVDVGFNREGSNVPFWSFFGRLLRLIEGHVSWAIASVIVTFAAWGPLLLNPESKRSIIAHELPQIASQLQFLAMAGLFLAIYLSMKMLPPRPARYKKHRHLYMLLQWAIMPIVSIGYGSLAALNAQTRLLLGRYLDKFDVTVKAVKE